MTGRGREAPILYVNTADLAEALGGEVVGDDQIICPGPGHSAEDRSLSITVTPGAQDGVVVHSFAGDDWRACKELVFAAVRDLPKGERRTFVDRPRPPPEKRKSFLYAQRLSSEASPARGTIAERYMAARGLPILPQARFHEYPPGSAFPVMILPVVDVDGRVIGYHFTYLRGDGAWKAPIDPDRRSFGAISGGAIRLGPVAERLLIAEGIESALTAMQVDPQRRPAWAAISAGNMAKLILPEMVRSVVILPDGDENGTSQKAAEKAAQRWLREGREVRIGPAPVRVGFKGTDLNDLLMERLGLHRPQLPTKETM